MDVVGHYAHLCYSYPMPLGDGPDCGLAVPVVGLLLEGIVPVLGAPLKMVLTHTNRVRSVRKILIFVVSTIYVFTYSRPDGRVACFSKEKV